MLSRGYLFKEVYINLSTAYRNLDDDSSAYDYAVNALNPSTPYLNGRFGDDDPIALNNLGLLAARYENDTMARELLELAWARGGKSEAAWNLGNCLLRMYCSNKYDDLYRCWSLYEHRFTKDNPVRLQGIGKIRKWDGRPGVPVTIYTEQGFGDQLMFARYLPLISNPIIVQCNERLKGIFPYETTHISDKPTTEFGIGFCSLGSIFNESIPPGTWLSNRYVPSNQNSVLRIGCTWSGSPDHPNTKYRDSNPDVFRSLASFGDLYTLNPTEANTPGFTTLRSDNWNVTIEELHKLDVVVCVDTSISHLCGSLGMKCMVLMPERAGDWRWGDSSMGLKNKWYPSVKVIRHNGTWENTMNGVKIELEKLQNGIW